ncbi:MAG: gliding motility-associated C-terminal domain-containing protein, partial [Saprospiraceae bacterium]
YITYYDRFNCEFTDTIFVFEPDPIQITFDSTIIVMELGDSLQLRPNITGAVVDSFVWTPAERLLYPDSIFPRAYAFESTTYTLKVWDVNGCTGTGSVFVKIDPNRNVYIPNIFIPGNTRGLNDHFNVFVGTGVEIVNYMQVYDRWGSLLYERNDFYPDNDVLNEGWNGKYKGEFVNPGVYVYIVEVKFLDGRVLLYRGDVTVAR